MSAVPVSPSITERLLRAVVESALPVLNAEDRDAAMAALPACSAQIERAVDVLELLERRRHPRPVEAVGTGGPRAALQIANRVRIANAATLREISEERNLGVQVAEVCQILRSGDHITDSLEVERLIATVSGFGQVRRDALMERLSVKGTTRLAALKPATRDLIAVEMEAWARPRAKDEDPRRDARGRGARGMKRGKIHYDWSTGWVRGYVRLGKRASTGGRLVKSLRRRKSAESKTERGGDA